MKNISLILLFIFLSLIIYSCEDDALFFTKPSLPCAVPAENRHPTISRRSPRTLGSHSGTPTWPTIRVVATQWGLRECRRPPPAWAYLFFTGAFTFVENASDAASRFAWVDTVRGCGQRSLRAHSARRGVIAASAALANRPRHGHQVRPSHVAGATHPSRSNSPGPALAA